jgi:hypothetical protein
MPQEMPDDRDAKPDIEDPQVLTLPNSQLSNKSQNSQSTIRNAMASFDLFTNQQAIYERIVVLQSNVTATSTNITFAGVESAQFENPAKLVKSIFFRKY